MKDYILKKDIAEIVKFIDKHEYKNFIISILLKRKFDNLSSFEKQALVLIKEKILEKGWTSEPSGIIMSTLSHIYSN